MEAQELRINNWVLKSVTGDDYAPYQITKGSHIDNADHFRPIPLTESILVAAGFEESDPTEYGGWVSPFFGTSAIRLRINANNQFYYTANKYSQPLYVSSLHQLQNLIFALYQSELTINLNQP